MLGKALATYVYNLLYAVDVLVNVLLGGDRRDTISSRLGKGQLAGKPVHTLVASLVNIFFLLAFRERQHCKNSVANIDDRYAISSILARYS